ncbi:MAG: DUF4054 domain-containing protein [Methylococcaceae bacterium]
MARVFADEVKEIIDTSLSDDVIGAYIQAANLTITKLLGSSTALSDDQKKEIERWFTAHLMACTREQQAKAEKAGEASITYQGKTGEGIKSTHYGQMCLVLDTTGILAASLGKRKISITAVTSFA